MPTTVTVMSWNVKQLGPERGSVGPIGARTPSGLIGFITTTIDAVGADLVGIMELRGGFASTILGWLLTSLNNLPGGGSWIGRVSARQDGLPQEEYILLWNERVGTLSIDPAGVPAPTATLGVVDADVLAPFWTLTGWTAPAQQKQLFAALIANQYIAQGTWTEGDPPATHTTRTYRVVPAQWQQLSTAAPPATVSFATGTTQPPAPLSPAASQLLAAQLLSTSLVQFVNYGGRSPFIGNFVIGAGNAPLMVVLMHAPKPEDIHCVAATNAMTLGTALRGRLAGGALLIMGDFNIVRNPGKQTGRAYMVGLNKRNVFGFWEASPVVLQKPFEPIEGNPLNATPLFDDNPDTSLKVTYFDDPATLSQVLSEPYDRFFFNAGTPNALDASGASVCELLGLLAYDGDYGALAFALYLRSPGPADLVTAPTRVRAAQTAASGKMRTANANVAAAQKELKAVPLKQQATSPATARLNRAQAALKTATDAFNDATNELAAITNLSALLTNPATVTPEGIGSAQAVYRHGVSDHLPITVTVTG